MTTPTPARLPFSPGSYFAVRVYLNVYDVAKQRNVPIPADSVVPAFLSQVLAPDAVAAHPALEGVAVHESADRWLVYIPAANLDLTLLDGLWNDGDTAYLMVLSPAETVYYPLVYQRNRPAVLLR